MPVPPLSEEAKPLSIQNEAGGPPVCCERWPNDAATTHADITVDDRDIAANDLVTKGIHCRTRALRLAHVFPGSSRKLKTRLVTDPALSRSPCVTEQLKP